MRKGEMTRQRIIELAAPLFNQRGYAGCSMADIMEATGLEKGGVYRHFHSKEELAAEALRFSLNVSVRIHTDDLQGIPSALDRLRAAMDRFVETPSAISGGCPLMNAAIDCDDGNPALLRLVEEALTRWRRRLARMVIEGIRSGEIRKDCKPREMADTLIAMLEGGLMLCRVDGSRAPLRNVRRSINLLLDAIAR